MQKTLKTAAIFGIAVAVACSNTSGPRSGLNILSGAGLTDTVLSTFRPPLTVQLLDSDHQPVSGQTVYFNTNGFVLVAYTNDPGFVIDRLPVTTDGNGYAAVWVEAKQWAATGKVVIVAPDGQSVEAHYTVLPGAPAFVRADPSDTSLYVGGSVTYRPFITDTYGNRLPVAPTYQYQSLSGALSVSGLSKATGAAIGRGSVAVSALRFADTVWASVVPQGRVAAQYGGCEDNCGPGYIMTLNLDGSAFDTIPGSFTLNHSLDWSPDGASIVVYRHLPNYLAAIDLAGHTRRIVTDLLMRSESFPQYAHDGSYIYFTGEDSLTNCYGVWRAHPDGTALEHVVADTSDCGPYVYQQLAPTPDYASSPSPDGTRIVYVNRTLRVHTLATAADTSLGVVGDRPRWSPTGEWIAYDSLGTLMLIHPDGTGRQGLLFRGDPGLPGVDWSPDGQWIVYWGYDLSTGLGGLHLVQVATGLKLPLRVAVGLGEPTWQP